jgi:DNA-binding MarR family transcriptional regulator
MPDMTSLLNEPFDIPEDAVVDRARRKETVRSALKHFRVLLDSIRRHAEWVEIRHGIGAPHLWALWELRQNPGMRTVDLAKFMAVHRQTAEDLLGELLEKALVREESNGQGSAYFITPTGERIAAAAPEYGQGVLKAAMERLPDSDLEQLVNILHRLNESLPMREDRAALKPMAELFRPTLNASSRKAHEAKAQSGASNLEK